MKSQGLCEDNKNSPISGHFSLLNPMIKIFLFCFYKIWFEPMFLTGSFVVLIRAAPPPFRIFAGGLSRRLRRRKRFGLIQVSCTTLEKSMPRPAAGGARRPNRTDFSGQKEIPDSVRSRKEKFSIPFKKRRLGDAKMKKEKIFLSCGL